MEGISLGSAYLRLYGDRSALDRELEKLRRYTEQLEKQGIKVKFDADTGQASREIDGLTNKIHHFQKILGEVQKGLTGDGAAWKGLADGLNGVAGSAAKGGGAMGKMAGALGGAVGVASKAIPVLGQLGLAAMGVQAIFQGVAGAINGVLAPLQALASEAGRFNKQVAEASIFASNAFAVYGPDGKAIQGTANQMRALRGTITKEFRAIQREVAQISGATASEIYDGFNIILQNAGALGKQGEDLSYVRDLAIKIAAAANTLNVPNDQLRSEVTSLLTGDVQAYDKLGRDLFGPNASQVIKQLQAEGRYADVLMEKLQKLYDGQKVLSASLENVASNYREVFQTISAEAGQALERGLAKAFQAVLDPLNNLQKTFGGFARSTNEFLEPVLKVLGEIGGWFVSAGSMIASTLQVVMDVLALGANIIGSALGPSLRAIGKVLQLVAKGFQLVATLVSAVLRPVTLFFRVFGDQNAAQVDDIFQTLFDGLDRVIGLADRVSQAIARPFIELAKWRAWLQGKLTGKSNQQIAGQQAEIENAFAGDLNTPSQISLKALGLDQATQAWLTEQTDKLGREGTQQRTLAIAKETSQLVQDRIKNEITGLEQALKLMTAQKGVQEALNQLAEGRRGLAMARATFGVQLAASPEARLAAEERKNDLALRQEQQRINERRSLLGTERQMLEKQLQVQLRQQQLQAEQLKIQRLELQVQRAKEQGFAKEIYAKMLNAAPGSKERAALEEQWRLAGEVLKLRGQQINVLDRSISLQNEAAAGVRETNRLEAQRLGIQGEQLDVQAQQAGLTREQQAAMADLQRREQAIKNALEERVNANNAQLQQLERQTRLLQEQDRLQGEMEKLERGRLEQEKARADAAVQRAEAELRVARAQATSRANPTSSRDLITAQIEALAAGTRGYVDEVAATKRLYDARERQLRAEQTMQRMQLEVQQARERSELQIYEWRLETLRLEADNAKARADAERQNLQLQQQRDAASTSGTIPGAPSTPALSPPQGAAVGPVGNMLPGTRGGPNINEGSGWSTRRGRMHNGQDLGLDVGDPIHARRGGKVTGILRDFGGVGDAVVVRYDNGQEGRYGHVNPGVRVGQNVQAGQRIATVTNDGGNTHLHYELRDGLGKLLNPLQAIKESLRQPAGTRTGSAVVAAQAAPSLQNSLNANTTALEESNQRSREIEQALAGIPAMRAQLGQQQGYALGALGASQAAQLGQLNTDRIRDELTARVLNSDRGRLATEISDAMTTGVTGVLKGAFGALRNGGSMTDVFEQVMGDMADRMLESLLDFALAPLQRAISGNTFRAVSGVDINALAAQYSGAPVPALPAGQSGPQAIPVVPFQELQANTEQLNQTITTSATTISRTASAAATTPAAFTQLNGALGAVMQTLGSIAMGVMGAQSMSKGGTYNTLMGLAGIFGAAGSITGMFGTGGIFAGKGGGGSSIVKGVDVPLSQMPAGMAFRAAGGPVNARNPYIVGERGPELFIPGSAGQIISNPQTRALMSSANDPWSQTRAAAASPFDVTRAAAGAGAMQAQQDENNRALAAALTAPAGPLDVRYELTRINNVDYVTAEQFQRGMSQAAERGRALTLSALKNSVKVRRSVGM